MRAGEVGRARRKGLSRLLLMPRRAETMQTTPLRPPKKAAAARRSARHLTPPPAASKISETCSPSLQPSGRPSARPAGPLRRLQSFLNRDEKLKESERRQAAPGAESP